MTLQAGTTIGSYEIVAPIGAGGMGEVYRARDAKLDREVALKVLSPELASSAEHLRRFEQEARAASALNHPNIISIYDVGRDDITAYIVMEYVDGQDLRSLSSEGPMPVKQVLRIACKVADGLAAAHERGIVHRDLKPENLMVSSEGFVKILDFGLAKLMRPWGADEPTVPHTIPGVIFGTTGYMSPEQASGKATDFRSDQFSFAVILYELLARRRPFDRPTAPETMTAIIREEAAPLSTFNESVPPELERIIMRCLEKLPNERYGSTRDLARDLREIRDKLTDTAGSGRRSTPPHTPAARRITSVVSIAAVVLAVAGISYVAWRNYRSPLADRMVRSLAVLPFRDLSGTTDGQLFADGVAETISSRLTQANVMRISSVLDGSARGTPKEIAEQHDADLLLRGSVQREGERVRVSYALVDPAGGAEVAGDTVTGSAADVFALEDLVADRVLQTLRMRRSDDARSSPSTGISGAADQTAYLEAVGLLSRSKDEATVDQAIGKLRSVLGNARDSALVNATLARALLTKYQMGHRRPFLDEAAVYAERAVQLDSKVPEAQVALGNVRRATGHFPEALQSFNAAMALQPRSAEAYLGQGSALEAMGRAADAERAFQRAIQLRPDWPLAYNRYGAFCFQRGRYDRAAELYRRVIALQPDSSRGYTNLGAVLQSMGRYDEALASHEKALQVQPNAISWSNVGTMRFYLGRYADAAAAFEKATQLAPNDYVVWSNLGDAYRWVPDRRAAAAAYGRSIDAARSQMAANPRDGVAQADIASCLAKSGDVDAAAREIRTALQLDPTNANVLHAAAVVSLLHGDTDGSMLWLSRAVDNGYAAADLGRDPELAALRSRADFVALLKRPKQQT